MKIYAKVLSFLVKLVSLPLKIGADNPKKVEFQTANALLPYLFGYNRATVDALFKQSWAETGDFTSDLFQQSNNAYGMRVPSAREWLGVGSYDTPYNGTFSVYSDVTHSLLDRILLDKYNKTNIKNTYIGYLTEVIEDKNYLPVAEHSVYWTLIQNAPAFNFFFKASISVICTIFGIYYIISRLG